MVADLICIGRLVRLIPPSHMHIRALLNHRLPKDGAAALEDWQDIVAGTSALWTPIPGPEKELLRSMLNHINFEILKRARPPLNTFNFSFASVGNLFLTGARVFTGSFESAIHLVSLICRIPSSVSVIPAINSNFSHHISAGLENGEVITGQNAISHPSIPTAIPERASFFTDEPEDANLPGSLPSLRQAAIAFSKGHDDDLSSRIERIWYINPYGQEIHIAPNPKVLQALQSSSAVVYSIGSLYSSIVPCLVLKGVGAALSVLPASCKRILILNGSIDRETGPRNRPMGAVDFVAAIARACEESKGEHGEGEASLWKQYVSHVVYVEGEDVPIVDKNKLSAAGVECVRCWNRKAEDGSTRFEERGLLGALEAVVGRGQSRRPSRRNTLVGHLPSN